MTRKKHLRFFAPEISFPENRAGTKKQSQIGRIGGIAADGRKIRKTEVLKQILIHCLSARTRHG
jgi:hypothetical protein